MDRDWDSNLTLAHTPPLFLLFAVVVVHGRRVQCDAIIDKLDALSFKRAINLHHLVKQVRSGPLVSLF